MKKLRDGAKDGILDRLPVLISYADTDGRIQYANPALLRACGKPLDMPAGVELREVLGDAVLERTKAQMARAISGETVIFLDANNESGTTQHFELTFIPDRGADGEVHGFLGVGYDQTDRVQAESRAAAREQRLSTILHTMAEGVVIHDREGRLVEANAATEELLSLTRQQLFDWDIARPHWEAIDENGLPLTVEELPVIRTLRTGTPVRGQIIGIRVAGVSVRWISVNADPLFDSRTTSPSGVIGTFSDVTALRASVERIRQLAQHAEDVREQERRELALLLHESLAQDLFSARLTLGNLRRDCPEAQRQALDELAQVLDRCLDDTRQVAGSLRPTGPADQPIGHIIGQHARYFGELARLHIEMNDGTAPDVMEESTRLLLFRAAQEAMANVARHARASRIDIFLGQSGTHVELRIEDDGIGLSPDALDKPGSLGLLGIRERARTVGGTLQLAQRGHGGTSFVLRLKLSATD